MSRQTYLWVGRLMSPLFIVGLRIFTKITGRPRVRILVTNEKNEVLLLRGVISHGRWTLAGGGMNRGETAAAAARRELHEETGIDVPESALTFVTTLARPKIDIPFVAPLFHVEVPKTALPSRLANPREVVDVGWFSRSNLPTPLSTIAAAALAEKIN